MRRILLYLLLVLPSCYAYTDKQPETHVKTGAQVLIEQHLGDLVGKRVGLVMNPTARINNTHVLDTLLALNVNVTALFAPEHGFRGNFSDGEIIENGIDTESGLPVFSLYGTTNRPTPKMLQTVDILLFDMQDVGARFYTYNTTMKYVIEAASEQDVEVWVLDRPNPAGGEYVAGWILESPYTSMVGAYPVPVAHGLTLGELALMAKGEQWFDTESEPLIKVITMQGWSRSMQWPETGLSWIPPSPNLPTFTHAYMYLGTCFVEGTTLSEGRGTPNPFLTFGAPDFTPDLVELAELGKRYHITIDTLSFTPVSIPGVSRYPKYENVELSGIRVTPTTEFTEPVEFGIELTRALMKMSRSEQYREYMTLLSGTQHIFSDSLNWGSSFTSFVEKRKSYLLYH